MIFDPRWADAISSIESGGRYNLLGPVTRSGDRAYGKYQVMGSNVGPWTKEVLGTAMTPQQFLSDPKAQDAVFAAKFGQYADKYGNPQDAASAWFTGRPLSQGANRADVLGTTGSSYVAKFNNALGVPQAVAQNSAPQMASPLPPPQTVGAPPQAGSQPQAQPAAQTQPGQLGALPQGYGSPAQPNLSGLNAMQPPQMPMAQPQFPRLAHLSGLASLLQNSPAILSLIRQG
jgi:hypothetical protein